MGEMCNASFGQISENTFLQRPHFMHDYHLSAKPYRSPSKSTFFSAQSQELPVILLQENGTIYVIVYNILK